MTYVTPAHTYQFEVEPTDAAGNVGTWAVGAPMTVAVVQESSHAIVYHGHWTRHSLSGAFGGQTKYAMLGAAWARLRFTGRAIAWIAPKSSTRGSAKIYIDGVYRGTVSLHSSAAHKRQIVYLRSWALAGSHLIKVVLIGTHGHPRVDIDAFVVLN